MIVQIDRMPALRLRLPALRRAAVLALLPALVLGGCSGRMPNLFSKRNSAPPASAQAPGQPAAAAAQPAAPVAAPVPPPRATFYTFCNLCLFDAEGRRVANADGMRGFLEGASRQGEKVVLSGWAADTRTRQPAAEILFVSKGTVLLRTRPEIPRPDVATALQLTGPNDRYGFEFSVDLAGIGEPMLVWAVDTEGRATPLGTTGR